MTVAVFDPSRPAFSPYGFTCMRWEASRTSAPDRHNEIEMTLLGSGALIWLVGGHRVRLEAGQLHVFWAAMPHQILAEEGAENFLVATVPLAWVLQWQLPPQVMLPLLQGRVLRNGEPQYSAEDVEMFSRWIDYMDYASAALQKIILLEAHARLLRFAFAEPSVLPEITPVSAPGSNPSELCHAERLAGFIAQHCTQSLSAEDMGRAVDLHPNYAMAVFKRTFGITLNDFLTRQRVSHAQRLLVTSDTPVTDVAFDSGFTSISRFNAAFRCICQCSPVQYRARNRVKDWGIRLP